MTWNLIGNLKGVQGDQGDSAYAVALENGFVGTEIEWLASLEGAPGDAGADGASAYEVAVANGFVGTEAEWLDSLVGASGVDGDDGSPGADGADGRTILSGSAAPTTEGEDGDFYIRTTTNFIYGPKAGGAWPAGVSLVGPAGTNGTNGTDGADGTDGVGVPVGGTTGQLLAKNSATDYDTEWVDLQITVSATAPSSPVTNQLWVDIS